MPLSTLLNLDIAHSAATVGASGATLPDTSGNGHNALMVGAGQIALDGATGLKFVDASAGNVFLRVTNTDSLNTALRSGGTAFHFVVSAGQPSSSPYALWSKTTNVGAGAGIACTLGTQAYAYVSSAGLFTIDDSFVAGVPKDFPTFHGIDGGNVGKSVVSLICRPLPGGRMRLDYWSNRRFLGASTFDYDPVSKWMDAADLLFLAASNGDPSTGANLLFEGRLHAVMVESFTVETGGNIETVLDQRNGRTSYPDPLVHYRHETLRTDHQIPVWPAVRTGVLIVWNGNSLVQSHGTDSLPSGTDTEPYTWAGLVAAALQGEFAGPIYESICLGIGGLNYDTMESTSGNVQTGIRKRQPGDKNILIAYEGTNSISGYQNSNPGWTDEQTAAQVFADAQSYANTGIADGYDYVVLGTMLPAGHAGDTDNYRHEPTRHAYNTSLRNWVAADTTGKLKLADLGDDPTMYTGWENSDLTLFDTFFVHPTSLGHAITAPYFTNTAAPLLPAYTPVSSLSVSGVPMAPVRAGSTHTLTAATLPSGAPDTGYLWSLTSGPGSIDPLTGIYTAPASGSLTDSVQEAVVRATSIAEWDKYVEASVPVQAVLQSAAIELANRGTTTITISESTAATGGFGSLTDTLQISSDEGDTWQSATIVSGSPLTATGLSENTAYQLRLQSVDTTGAQVLSNVISVTTVPNFDGYTGTILSSSDIWRTGDENIEVSNSLSRRGTAISAADYPSEIGVSTRKDSTAITWFTPDESEITGMNEVVALAVGPHSPHTALTWSTVEIALPVPRHLWWRPMDSPQAVRYIGYVTLNP